MTIEFTIVGDESGHDYVIPFNKRDAWYEWLESDEVDSGEVPDYAHYIDGGDVVFTRWRIA